MVANTPVDRNDDLLGLTAAQTTKGLVTASEPRSKEMPQFYTPSQGVRARENRLIPTTQGTQSIRLRFLRGRRTGIDLTTGSHSAEAMVSAWGAY